jgi:hypothetical protein
MAARSQRDVISTLALPSAAAKFSPIWIGASVARAKSANGRNSPTHFSMPNFLPNIKKTADFMTLTRTSSVFKFMLHCAIVAWSKSTDRIWGVL